MHLVEHGNFADYEVYAFAALWRQHLELMLKALVQVANRPNSDEILRSHELLPLWDSLQSFFDEQAAALGGSNAERWNEARELLAHIIRDFNRLDRHSFDFRYSANRDRTASTLQNAPSRINVNRLNRWMEWTAATLGGAFDAVTAGDGEIHAPGTGGPKLGGR
jgi:hypothetical protein